ncbi:MAG: hypothetical protein ACK5P7_12780 [Bdellovibrio sp.]|jgi:hypothetical protein
MFALKNIIPSLMTGEQLLLKHQEAPPGLRTGYSPLDQRLSAGGIPRGGLSLWVSPLGYGATSLWLQTARPLHGDQKWSAWISSQTTLFAPAVWNKGVDLKSLYLVRAPNDIKEWTAVLKDCLMSDAFTLIGCEVPSLAPYQKVLKQLRRLAENANVSFVFLSNDVNDLKRTEHFEFVMQIQTTALKVLKCKGRPSFTVPWSQYEAILKTQYDSILGSHYDANFLPQLQPQSRGRTSDTGVETLGRGVSSVYTSATFSRTRDALGRREQNDMALQKLQKPA